jgi:hypothetical protein
MPKTPPNYKAVTVQFQRFVPQLATVTVAVPKDWKDKVIESRLSDIYEAAVDADVEIDWHDQVNVTRKDIKEGDHELSGSWSEKQPDLVYPEQEDDDGNDD